MAKIIISYTYMVKAEWTNGKKKKIEPEGCNKYDYVSFKKKKNNFSLIKKCRHTCMHFYS